jgi:hypothetical protein
MVCEKEAKALEQAGKKRAKYVVINQTLKLVEMQNANTLKQILNFLDVLDKDNLTIFERPILF